MSEPEVPQIVRTRPGGIAWYEEWPSPLRQIELLLRELDELDPDRGRSQVKQRVAIKVNRIISLVAELGLDEDDEIRVAIRDALQERVDSWSRLTFQEILAYMREMDSR